MLGCMRYCVSSISLGCPPRCRRKNRLCPKLAPSASLEKMVAGSCAGSPTITTALCDKRSGCGVKTGHKTHTTDEKVKKNQGFSLARRLTILADQVGTHDELSERMRNCSTSNGFEPTRPVMNELTREKRWKKKLPSNYYKTRKKKSNSNK